MIVAAAASFRAHTSRSFLLSLVLLPPIVQTVIMLVNGSIGTGIAVPESLNHAHAFDDVFTKYTKNVRLVSVKTTHIGSLFKLTYTLSIANAEKEKELIDALRCRNGNLEIALGIPAGAEGEFL